ncbi:type VI secretion system TssO [Dysgonomonas sp. 511]|uniref:type VI secretion system TssO n=1 Tax=Dysgonomonas sp. 511 TaxID=2302930 RepID=UPI0013CFDDAA|nr:type VI secretion system TssO [Dysgonomonas sp. 511]NDV78478.1 hypothetical protein [Dysgonomonas sp. 511]
MEQKKKITKNQREKNIGFVYVSALFLLVTFICCSILFYYADTKFETNKRFVIAKMDYIRKFQNVQNEQMIIVDSIYNKIKCFDLSVKATYEANDIRIYLDGFKEIYNKNATDGRYKIFSQTSVFYNMWFSDRRELWSRKQNIVLVRQNLEECRVGLEKKNEELKNIKK